MKLKNQQNHIIPEIRDKIPEHNDDTRNFKNLRHNTK